MFFCEKCNFKYTLMSTVENNTAIVYFKCNNCGFKTNVLPQTLICQKTMHSKQTIKVNPNIVHDPTLPITKHYVCPNKNCDTFKNPLLKEAVFAKQYDSNVIVQICKVCKTLVV